MPKNFLSPVRLVILLAGAFFVTEFMLMILLQYYPELSDLETAFIDSSVLIIVLSPLLYFLFFRPVQREAKARLQVEKELKKRNLELDSFVENVAHSLRSPLNPIVGSAWFLHNKYQKTFEGGDAELLSIIEQDSRRLLKMIDDLVALSRLQEDDRPPEALDVGEIVREVLHKLRDEPVEAGNSFEVGTLPRAYVSRSLLAIALDNLIRNAVHYGSKDGAPIKIYGQQDDGSIRLFVRDHGKGVPEEERSRIFDVLYRGAKSKDLPGSGIGLALVQKIARLYRGHAWVEETPGGGATFGLEFRDDRY